MSVIPPPPVRPDDPRRLRVTVADLRAAVASGLYGQCCMCQNGNTRWLDLSACGIEPVTDRHGDLTDQVSVHDRCVLALASHWRDVIGGERDDQDEQEAPDVAVPEPAGEVVWGQTTATHERVRRMGGVYAR